MSERILNIYRWVDDNFVHHGCECTETTALLQLMGGDKAHIIFLSNRACLVYIQLWLHSQGACALDVLFCSTVAYLLSVWCDTLDATVISCCCSGVGGQMDFIRGAALGYDGLGKPIIAISSTTEKGESKIVPCLKPGISLWNCLWPNFRALVMRNCDLIM